MTELLFLLPAFYLGVSFGTAWNLGKLIGETGSEENATFALLHSLFWPMGFVLLAGIKKGEGKREKA